MSPLVALGVLVVIGVLLYTISGVVEDILEEPAHKFF